MRSFLSLLTLLLFFTQPLLFAHSPLIGIMGVDEQELGCLIQSLEGPIESRHQAMRSSYRGKLSGVDVVIAISNVGKAAAASAAVDLIRSYQIDALIVIGTAGAIQDRAQVGDVVIATGLLEYDLDLRPLAARHGSLSLPMACVPSHPALAQLALNTALEAFQERGNCHQVLTGFVATADRFLLDQATLSWLASSSPELLCLEMESAAIAQVCAEYRVADLFIRTISNEVVATDSGENKTNGVANDYHSFLHEVQWVYCDRIIKPLLPKIADHVTQQLETADYHGSKKASYRVEEPAPETIAPASLSGEEQLLVELSSPLSILLSSGSIEKQEQVAFLTQQPQHSQKPSYPRYKPTIGLLCSLPEEAKAFGELLKEKEVQRIAHHEYLSGQWGSLDLVITSSGMGKCGSAIAITELILTYGVDLVLAVGTALPIDASLSPGDLVIGQYFIETDVDVRPFRARFELPVLGKTQLPADSQWNQLLVASLSQERDASCSYLLGGVASHDCHQLDAETLSLLRREHPTLLCLDGDTAPAAQIAYQYGCPLIAIKVVTDRSPFDRQKLTDQTIGSLSSLIDPFFGYIMDDGELLLGREASRRER